MLSNDIEQIISSLKSEPNSLHRNKAVSHAEDMLAHVKLMELGKYPNENLNGLREPENASKIVSNLKQTIDQMSGCNCQMGMRSKTCPVHGGF